MTTPTKLTIENTTPEASSACLEYDFGKGECLMVKFLLPRQVAGPSLSLEQVEVTLLRLLTKVVQSRLAALSGSS
jgi:hypothetical protein